MEWICRLSILSSDASGASRRRALHQRWALIVAMVIAMLSALDRVIAIDFE